MLDVVPNSRNCLVEEARNDMREKRKNESLKLEESSNRMCRIRNRDVVCKITTNANYLEIFATTNTRAKLSIRGDVIHVVLHAVVSKLPTAHPYGDRSPCRLGK